MENYRFSKLELDGAYLIQGMYAGDNRGGFCKLFEKQLYENAGINFNLSEAFVSVSKKNVIRGMHFQTRNPQAKLVCVLKGRVWDVIVDLRMDSPTYKKWIGIELSEDNHNALYVPKGFAHGFVALEDGSTMLYQCDGKYDKETDTGIIYNSKDLKIEWPISEKESIHSKRDLQLMSIQEYEKNPMVI